MSLLPKAIYTFNAIAIKIPPVFFFAELEQRIQKLVWRLKKAVIARAILEKKNRTGGIMIQDFKLYCKAIIIKTVWYWYKNRHIEKNRIEDSEMYPQLYGQLIFNKAGKNIKGKKTIS